MELTDLYIFIAIFKEKNVSRAAEQLGYVQSNVTARLRNLEEELGVALFQRHARGVTPTAKGELFYNQVHEILNRLEDAITNVKASEHPSGPLAIGMVETFMNSRFMNKLTEYRALYPEVELTIHIGSSRDLTGKVLDRDLDGAFISGKITSGKLVCEISQPEEIALVTSTGLVAEDLPGQTWIVFPKDCPYRSVTEQWLRTQGITSPKILEISTLGTLLTCISSGLGISILPSTLSQTAFHELTTHPLPDRFKYINTSFIRRKDRFVSKAMEAFLDIVKRNDAAS